VYGYRLLPRDPRRAIVAVVGSVALVTAIVLVADCVIFRQTLPAGYVRLFSGPDLMGRIRLFAAKAMLEEVAFRLVVMGAIVAVGGWLDRDRKGVAAPFIFVIAILVAQAVNLGLQLRPPSNVGEDVYDLLRFYLPGVVWGWLCWRHGFISAFAAHPLTHLVLQPLLQATL
jgi:hypothetical protein